MAGSVTLGSALNVVVPQFPIKRMMQDNFMAACTANYTGQLHLYRTMYFISIILSVVGTGVSVGPLNDAILKNDRWW